MIKGRRTAQTKHVITKAAAKGGSETSMPLLFHAPNVHSGGGLRLLMDVLAVAPASMRWVQLDARVEGKAQLPADMTVRYVPKSFQGRLAAEWRLFREVGPEDTVIAFNGLPPLFPLRGKTVVFLQNILLVQRDVPKGYPRHVRARLMLERFWFRLVRRKGIRYVVQTPSMADVLRRRIGEGVAVQVASFRPRPAATEVASLRSAACRTLDFAYVATGDTHKNHRRLLEAWALLAARGERPRLALTVDRDRYPELCSVIDTVVAEHGLRIDNLGALSFDEINVLYALSGALIFPSITESFGLPLMEAAAAGLPILAPEMDYVRDVVVPAETFDPASARSIARAVMRFMGRSEPLLEPMTAEDFLARIAE